MNNTLTKIVTETLLEDRDVTYNYRADINKVCTLRKMDLCNLGARVPEELRAKASEIKKTLDDAFKNNSFVSNFQAIPTSMIRKAIRGNAYESTIQGTYAAFLTLTSGGRITISDRGRTDGILSFYDEHGKFIGYGLVEYKRKATGKNQYGNNVITHGLLQAIAYYFRVLTDEERALFKVFVVACEDYFISVNKSDILNLVNKLEPLIKASSDCPSSLYKDYQMVAYVKGEYEDNREAFHRIDIDYNSMFNGIVEEMFFNIKYVA